MTILFSGRKVQKVIFLVEVLSPIECLRLILLSGNSHALSTGAHLAGQEPVCPLPGMRLAVCRAPLPPVVSCWVQMDSAKFPALACSPWRWPLLNRGQSLSVISRRQRLVGLSGSRLGSWVSVCVSVHVLLSVCIERIDWNPLVSMVSESQAKVKVVTRFLIGRLSDIHHSTPCHPLLITFDLLALIFYKHYGWRALTSQHLNGFVHAHNSCRKCGWQGIEYVCLLGLGGGGAAFRQ